DRMELGVDRTRGEKHAVCRRSGDNLTSKVDILILDLEGQIPQDRIFHAAASGKTCCGAGVRQIGCRAPIGQESAVRNLAIGESAGRIDQRAIKREPKTAPERTKISKFLRRVD